MREQRQTAAPVSQRLSLKQKLLILSRRDRMGKAKPTWYRVLAACLALSAGILLLNVQRRNRLALPVMAAEPKTAGSCRLSFAGDLKLTDSVELRAQQEGWDCLYRHISPLWQDSDFVFACLDGVILPNAGAGYEPLESAQEPACLSAEALSAAVRAGINAYALANDQSFSYGSRGLEQTIGALQAEGVDFAGAGENLSTAGTVRYLEQDGLRVAFLSCSAINPNGAGPNDDYCLITTAYSDLYRNVFRARMEADLVVVYVCWGELNGLRVTEGQRNVAQQLIRSGANLVIGTHPHVLQPIEQFQDGWIFYSLGDLVSDRNQRAERESALLRIDIEPDSKAGSMSVIPLLLEDFAPVPTDNWFYTAQIHQSLLRELPKDSYRVTEDGRIQIPFRLS